MESLYLIQVVRRDTGAVVSWAPGLGAERVFVDEIVNRVGAKGVGVGRTTSHVLTDVRTAIEELLFELKAQVR